MSFSSGCSCGGVVANVEAEVDAVVEADVDAELLAVVDCEVEADVDAVVVNEDAVVD